MNITAKLALGVVAFAAPITAGWMVTTSPSLLNGIGAGNHTIDEFEMSGYWVVREDIDGAVTSVVTGPDGEVVAAEDVPADIADKLANWAPPEPLFAVDLDRQPACYSIVGDIEGEQREVGDINGRGYLIRADSDNGPAVVEAVALANFADIDEDLEAYVDSSDPLIDLPGATEMGECP